MATSVRSVRSVSYERDFAAWAEAQAEALRAGRLDALDLANLAEEIGDLSNRERDALESHLETLIMHLLKWRYQPARRSRSWEATIRVARRNIAKLLRRSPSLRRGLSASLDEVYPNARIRAAVATRLPDDAMPETCPFTVDQITGEWMP
jgi:ribosomal protein L29